MIKIAIFKNNFHYWTNIPVFRIFLVFDFLLVFVRSIFFSELCHMFVLLALM